MRAAERPSQAHGLDLATSPEIVRYQRPELPPTQDVLAYYALAEERSWYSNDGPCAQQLAARLADYVGGAAQAVPLASCTTGLMAVLRALCGEPKGIRRGIVTPSFTFPATAGAIVWAGFEPVFVDVEPGSWQLDPLALRRLLDERGATIAGILACSTFGTAPPERTRAGWREAAAAHGLPLVLDSAAGFGAVDERGRRIGGLGDTEVFSFHATKPFAIGEGGALLTPDPDLAERVRKLLNFGIDSDSRVSEVAGLNGKMSELHAATALAMLDRFDEALSRRRATAAAARHALSAFPLSYQEGAAGSTWQVLQVLAPSVAARDATVAAAAELGVQVRTCFDPPLHRHPAYARYVRAELPVTDALAARALSLPMANTLAPGDIARIMALVERGLA